VKDVNPKLAAFALLGMLNWTYQWYKASGSIPLDERKPGVAGLHPSHSY